VRKKKPVISKVGHRKKISNLKRQDGTRGEFHNLEGVRRIGSGQEHHMESRGAGESDWI